MPKYIMSFECEYRFLSNFVAARVKIPKLYLNGSIKDAFERYPTTEHAYQAAKTISPTERTYVREASTPGIAKRRGREVTLRSDWEAIKDHVMLDLLRAKFSHEYPEFKQKLIDTEDAILVEGNTWHDNHFGVCTCIRCGGVGKNVLGEALMRVRKEVQINTIEVG